MNTSSTLYLPGINNVQLAATSFGKIDDPTVLLLHGAGQTRHSWRHAGAVLAAAGLHAITIDTRGHGDSDWSKNGDYAIDTLIADLKSVVEHLGEKDKQKPILVGASLGGITALLTEGESDQSIFQSLVLVDITPRIDQTGVKKILGFMQRYENGFDSVEQASKAVAEYQSHRQRISIVSQSNETSAKGLKKNLRQAQDGRYYWHWDPQLMQHISTIDDAFYQRQRDAALELRLPVLLIRGQQSEIVSVESANELLQLVPHAQYVDIADAAHMVAGDNNDVFVNSVLEFISR